MQKRNFKKNPTKMLPRTEAEINEKYKLQKLNFDEFYDFFEKEIILNDFIDKQQREHEFLKLKEIEFYER